jgi:hypothetical protein
MLQEVNWSWKGTQGPCIPCCLPVNLAEQNAMWESQNILTAVSGPFYSVSNVVGMLKYIKNALLANYRLCLCSNEQIGIWASTEAVFCLLVCFIGQLFTRVQCRG